MGTPAATRISKNNDYIELHTRWDGIPDVIKDQILNIPVEWQTSIDLFKKSITDTAFESPLIREWLMDLETTLHEYVQSPDLEKAALFFAGRSFVHHHPLPVDTGDSNLLEYWGKGNPDVVAKLGDTITFEQSEHYNEDDDLVESDVSAVDLFAKNINKDYKVLRIEMLEIDDETGEVIPTHSYIDLKYKNINEDELRGEILLLPLFWRDLYTVSKKVEDDLNTSGDKKHFNQMMNKPLLKLTRKLKSFYTTTKKYTAFGCDPTDKVFTSKEKIEARENIIDLVEGLIPFDMYTNSLATQLAVRFPGKVFFMTASENLSNPTPDMTVYLSGDGMSKLFVTVNDEHEATQFLTDVQSTFKARESKFLLDHNLVDNQKTYPLIHDDKNLLIGIDYEMTVIDVMENQRDIELNNLNR